MRSEFKSEGTVERYNAQLRELEAKMNDNRMYRFLIILTALLVLIFFSPRTRNISVEYPIVTYFDLRFFPLSGIMVYSITIFLVIQFLLIAHKALVLLDFPRNLYREFKIETKFLHPDRCGGLRPLGDLCIRFDYILLILLIYLILRIFFHYDIEFEVYFYLFLSVAYFSIVTLIFFYPLWPIHALMKTQKRALMNKLSKKLDPMYRELIVGRTNISAKDLEKIGKMDMIYNRANEMPVWPFDTGSLIKFFSTVFIPILGIILQNLL